MALAVEVTYWLRPCPTSLHNKFCLQKSTLGPLFLDGQREAVADMLNQAVLYAELQIEDATQPAPQVWILYSYTASLTLNLTPNLNPNSTLSNTLQCAWM